jgi:hypothetical protein
MLKGGFTAKTAQLVERLQPDLLDNILHLALPPGITPGRGKHPRRVLDHQRFKTGAVTLQNRGYQFGF